MVPGIPPGVPGEFWGGEVWRKCGERTRMRGHAGRAADAAGPITDRASTY